MASDHETKGEFHHRLREGQRGEIDQRVDHAVRRLVDTLEAELVRDAVDGEATREWIRQCILNRLRTYAQSPPVL